jgi:HlyD family secretion protein
MQKKRRKVFWLLGVALVLVVVGGLLLAFRSASSDEIDGPTEKQNATAFIGDLSANSTAPGYVVPAREVMLSARTPGLVEAVYARVGDNVREGDPLVQLDTTDLAYNVSMAELNLRLAQARLADLIKEPGIFERASAEANVLSTQAALDDLLAGPSDGEVAASEANLRAAEASLWAASSDLSSVRNSISIAQIQSAEAGLLSAQLILQQAQDANWREPNEATHNTMRIAEQAAAEAQARLDDLRSGPDQGQLATAQGNLTSASARKDGSQASLSLLVGGPTMTQISAAEAQLAQAEAALSILIDGPSIEQLKVAEAEVKQAALNLEDAEQATAEATIRAPLTGLVSDIRVSPGEMTSGIVAAVVDLKEMLVLVEVDEMDLGEIAVGQKAAVILEAWPSEEFEGFVNRIAPSSSSNPGSALVTYEVELTLAHTDLPVLAGMTADANLVMYAREDVLLVPNQAIQADRSTGTFSVMLVDGDTVSEVSVTIGLRDDRYTEIISGLSEGDQIQIGGELPTNSFEPGPGGGMFGGQ